MIFSLDHPSMVMVILAVFMSVCALSYRGRPSLIGFAPICAFCLFACLACAASEWLVFVVFLELSSLALAFSVGERDGETARFYLYSQLAGGAFLLVATAIASISGSAMVGAVPREAMPFFLLGLGVKVAFPFLHFWLPRTHSQAPTEASVLLSGYSVKIGIYGLLRLIQGPSPELVFLGALMAIYGVLQALMQHDGKRLLAYHTVSQLGFMVTALGAGTDMARSAALFHVVAHGIFKGLLFMSAGTLEKLYGTRDLGLLGKAARDYPCLFVLFLVGATAIAGFPGTSGYFSKYLIKTSLNEYPYAILALQIAGVGTTLSFCKFCYYGFIRPARDTVSEKMPLGKCKIHHLLPMAAMALVTLSSGTLSNWITPSYPALAVDIDVLAESLVPISVGISFFLLFPWIFLPGSSEIPDVEDALPLISRVSSRLLALLRSSHAGKLRLYITLILVSILIVMTFLWS